MANKTIMLVRRCKTPSGWRYYPAVTGKTDKVKERHERLQHLAQVDSDADDVENDLLRLVNRLRNLGYAFEFTSRAA